MMAFLNVRIVIQDTMQIFFILGEGIQHFCSSTQSSATTVTLQKKRHVNNLTVALQTLQISLQFVEGNLEPFSYFLFF